MKNIPSPSENTVILMTATVDPDGMGYTALQDSRIRKSQYLEAIDYFLNTTSYHIVFCENTGTDLFDEIASPQKHARLEYLTFNGNDYDKQRGKSYGEACIIQYAIQNSHYLKEAGFVIKITGRVKILNLDKLENIVAAASRKEEAKNIIAIEFSNRDWARSVCFFAPKEWFLKTVEKYGESLSDTGYNFEKMMSDAIADTKGMKICRFHPTIDGICGFSGQPYPHIHTIQRKLNHFEALQHVYRNRGEKLHSIIARLRWFCYVAERKIYTGMANGKR